MTFKQMMKVMSLVRGKQKEVIREINYTDEQLKAEASERKRAGLKEIREQQLTELVELEALAKTIDNTEM